MHVGFSPHLRGARLLLFSKNDYNAPHVAPMSVPLFNAHLPSPPDVRGGVGVRCMYDVRRLKILLFRPWRRAKPARRYTGPLPHELQPQLLCADFCLWASGS
jgi:hypothetical protein